MYRSLLVASALIAASTAPSLAEWNVLKPAKAEASATEICMVVDRDATPGENKVAGPFATEEEGKTAAMDAPACKNNDTSNAPSGSDTGGADNTGNTGGSQTNDTGSGPSAN